MNETKKAIDLLFSRIARIEALLDDDTLPTTTVWDLCEEEQAIKEEIQMLEDDLYYEEHGDEPWGDYED